MSDWLEVLRQKCDETSQAHVRRELSKYQPDGYPSAQLICQVLSGKYPCPPGRLVALVEGIYMSGTVVCPVVGEIPSDQCIENQGRPFSTVNPIRRALYRACRSGCEHSKLEV